MDYLAQPHYSFLKAAFEFSARRLLNIHHLPDHDRVGLQSDIISRRRLNVFQVVRLNLEGHELLELPVPVREHMRVAPGQDLLDAVILRHSCVPAIAASPEGRVFQKHNSEYQYGLQLI